MTQRTELHATGAARRPWKIMLFVRQMIAAADLSFLSLFVECACGIGTVKTYMKPFQVEVGYVQDVVVGVAKVASAVATVGHVARRTGLHLRIRW
jgi:hypothetical protein